MEKDFMKKYKIIILLVSVFALCMCLAACKSKTLINEYESQGYVISVTYDGNGGNFMGRNGVTLIDMFNPDSSAFSADTDGVIRIKLTEPTDSSRIKGSLTSVALYMPDHFFAGWYKNRTIKTVTVNGEEFFTDEFGKIIEEKEGKYYYPIKEGQDKPEEATPGYDYSDRWDFEEDRIEYTPGQENISFTLYAGWVPYYEFEYYALNESGEWEEIGSTSFNYKLATEEGSGKSDYVNAYMPRYVEGAMNYEHEYQDKNKFVFPKISGKTFAKAYTDDNMENEITDYVTHGGSLDVETATPVNRVKKIYVTFEEGEIYKITTAKQFADNLNAEGIFEIYNDLDFANEKWPNYIVQTFNGQIKGIGGVKKFSNISALFSSSTATEGGLFGSIGARAVIKDVAFENVTVSFSNRGQSYKLSETYFGLLAGRIEEVTENGETKRAEISGVTVSGSVRLGNIILPNEYGVNLIANGNTEGITAGEIELYVFGAQLMTGYSYSVDPSAVTVDENLQVNLVFPASLRLDEAEYKISYDL